MQVAANKAKHRPGPSPLSQLDIGHNMRRVVSFLTCNFFQMRFAALCITFIINFLLLFYKASAVENSENGDDENEEDGSSDEEASGGDDGGEDEDPEEWIHVDPEYYYVETIVNGFAITHACIAFFMVIAYYNLKVKILLRLLTLTL